MRVAYVGSREFADEQLVRHCVQLEAKGPVIVSGGERCPYSWAADEGRTCGFEVGEFLPDWEKHGRGAGMIRNKEIVRNCDMVKAFWDGESKGTKNTIDTAQKMGVPVDVIFDVAKILTGEA